MAAAVKDLILAQPVAGAICVALSDAAVVAVVFTDIGYLDKSSDKYAVAVDPFLFREGNGGGVACAFPCVSFYKLLVFRKVKGAAFFQLIN